MVGRRPVMYLDVQNLVLDIAFSHTGYSAFWKLLENAEVEKYLLEVPGNFEKVYYVVCEIKFTQQKVNRDMVTVAKGGS